MRASVAVLLLCSIARAQGIPKQLQAAEWADARAIHAAAEGDLAALVDIGIRAAPVLIHERETLDPGRDERVKQALEAIYRFRVDSFGLKDATLAEACRKLTEVSGVTVRADGKAAKPITLAMRDTGFWEIVLEICRKGDVGLAPHYREHRHDTWMPGFRGSPVILGGTHPRPTHAYADGPVLVQLSASEIGGERAGKLEITARYVPEVPVRAVSLPQLNGDDWES